jgi:hypothetical protein
MGGKICGSSLALRGLPEARRAVGRGEASPLLSTTHVFFKELMTFFIILCGSPPNNDRIPLQEYGNFYAFILEAYKTRLKCRGFCDISM